MIRDRLLLLACAGALLGGCAVEVPFECVWTLTVAVPPGSRGAAVPMDLAAQEEVWARREQVEEVRAQQVRLTVVGVGARNRAAVAMLGLGFRADGAPESGEQDVPMLPRSELPIVIGSSVEVAPPEGLGLGLQDALRGSGRFTLLLESEAGAVMEATFELGFAGSVVATP